MPCNPAVRGSLLPVAAVLVWTLPALAQQPPGPQPRAEPPGVAAAAVPAASSGGSAPASYPGEEARLGQLAGKLEASDRTTSDGTAYDDWLYQGRAGERLTIIMRSGSLDTYLRFGRLVGDRFTQIETDDDGAGGTDSRCDVTLPAAGVYVIRANTLFAGFGDYVLEVRRR